MTADQFLTDYGYAAVFAGCLLEGETILLIAGYAARKGHLSLPVVMMVATVAAIVGDQIFFFIGRHYGRRLLQRFPKLLARAMKVDELIVRYHGLVIVGVRFMYGMRIVGPIVIGGSGIPRSRLLAYNALGAVLWAVAIAGAGYCFGATLEMIPGSGHKDEWIGVGILVTLVVATALWHRFSGRTKKD